MTYGGASKTFLHLQPRLISSLPGPLGDQTAVALTARSGARGAVRFWRLVFDETHPETFLHMPVCPNGITHFSLPIYLLALLSPTWEGQTPPAPRPHQKRSDNCRRLFKKNAGKGKRTGIYSPSRPPIGQGVEKKKKLKGIEATGSWKRTDCATITHQSVNHNLSSCMSFMNKKLKFTVSPWF